MSETTNNKTNQTNTSRHEGRYTTNRDGRVFTLVVMPHADGFDQVSIGFAGKHYASLKNAERAVARFIAQA
jgi:hypothetical protein